MSLNPYLAEPHTLLAQCYLIKGDFNNAAANAHKALDLLQQWGTDHHASRPPSEIEEAASRHVLYGRMCVSMSFLTPLCVAAGVNWDKRVSFEAWVAWTRVLALHAHDKTIWHGNSWGVINLGLVK